MSRTLRRARFTAPASMAAMALVVTGCGNVTQDDEPARASGDASYPVEVRNCGREVSVDAAPERVVSLHPSITELLIQLGVGDRGAAVAEAMRRKLLD